MSNNDEVTLRDIMQLQKDSSDELKELRVELLTEMKCIKQALVKQINTNSKNIQKISNQQVFWKGKISGIWLIAGVVISLIGDYLRDKMLGK